MLLPRFFIPDITFNPGGAVELGPEEVRHAARVLRLSSGDQVMGFNGRGEWAIGVLDIPAKRRAVIRVEQTGRDPAPEQDLWLACAWPHTAAVVDEIVTRATEIGVDQIIFWKAERSQRPPLLSPRMQRVAVAACKQCGRNRLPAFDAVPALDRVLGGNPPRTWLAALEPGWRDAVNELVLRGNCGVVIGPEGGFTEHEVNRLEQAGAIPISLGRQVLRIEVAAVTACALVLNGMGRLGTRFPKPVRTS